VYAKGTPATSYFERIGSGRFRPTVHAGGAWDPSELHFGPVSALMVHAIERHVGAPRTGMLLSRVSFDIFGRLAADDCEITVKTIRPGRTIELVEATLVIRDRVVATARAWFLGAVDTGAVAGGGASPLPAPEDLADWDLTSVWPGGFVASLAVRGERPRPGRATAWLSTDVELVAEERVSPLASYVALIDPANGIGSRESADEWIFPNVDLTLHFHRQPQGRMVGLDITVVFGPAGQGVTTTQLHDLSGPVGYAQQSVTVRPASG
jgi:hypothetical protein